MSTLTEYIVRPDTVATWTPEARDTLLAMSSHVKSLACAYGPDHRWATQAAQSFAHVVTDLVRWERIRVMKDGPLSLFCITGEPQKPGLVFGIIFHGTHRRCTHAGCHAVINDDGRSWTYMRTDRTCDTGRGLSSMFRRMHEPLYPLGAPTPGTWSFHS